MILVGKIIVAVLSFMGLLWTAHELDKREEFNTTFSALCVGSISVCSIMLGLMLGSIFF